MTLFWSTFFISTLLILICLFFLAIGWLCTGKIRMIRGACGMNPHRKCDKECAKSNKIECDLCKKHEGTDERNESA